MIFPRLYYCDLTLCVCVCVLCFCSVCFAVVVIKRCCFFPDASYSSDMLYYYNANSHINERDCNERRRPR